MAWKTPENAKYTETDEWIIVTGNTAKIGLTDYAQNQLSDIVFVDLSEMEVGGAVSKGEAFTTVESVKAASDVNAPASGEIVAVNDALDGKPDLINEDPFGRGWIVEIKLSSPSDVNGLMDAAAYAKYCEGRGG
ncbi:MAG: glycine cleavage system protein GcvH [Chloroflexi bacterium]|nr:glycine cleavage system protein GcvH [Chloroflexota bacterium]